MKKYLIVFLSVTLLLVFFLIYTKYSYRNQILISHFIDQSLIDLHVHSGVSKRSIEIFIDNYQNNESQIRKEDLIKIFDEYKKVLWDLSKIINTINLVGKNDYGVNSSRFDIVKSLRKIIESNKDDYIHLTQAHWNDINKLLSISSSINTITEEMRISIHSDSEGNFTIEDLARLLNSIQVANKDLIEPF